MIALRDEILVAARPQDVYRYAADTAHWPQYLPHYRYVRVLDEEGGRRSLEMAARRGPIPVRWRALQWNDPHAPAIRFVHTAGWTRGMEVWWRFEREGTMTRVRIEHELTFAFPIARRAIERYVVGEFFIRGIAGRTLACMKRLAESDARG